MRCLWKIKHFLEAFFYKNKNNFCDKIIRGLKLMVCNYVNYIVFLSIKKDLELFVIMTIYNY